MQSKARRQILVLLLAPLFLLGVLRTVLSPSAAGRGGGERRGPETVVAPTRSAPTPTWGLRAPLQAEGRVSTGVRSIDAVPLGASAFTVRGRVIDLQGRPVPGVALALERTPRRVRALADAEGRFETELPSASSRLISSDTNWITVRACLPAPGRAEEENLVIVAPPRNLGGRVISAGGAVPIADAALELLFSLEELPGFVESWLQTGRMEWCTRSGPEGAFLLERVPELVGTSGDVTARLQAGHPGFTTKSSPMSPGTRTDLTVRLLAAEAPEMHVTGRVTRSDGRAASGAVVRLGASRVRADVAGRFQLTCGADEHADELVALLEGFGSGRVTGLARRLAGAPRPLVGIDVVLDGLEARVSGVLLSSQGQPTKGWTVQLQEQDESRVEGIERASARTDMAGRFRFDVPAGRVVFLRAFGNRVGDELEHGPYTSPAVEIELRLPSPTARGPIIGRVVDEDGRPIVGALVGVARPRQEHAGVALALLPHPRVTTLADGSFRLDGVPEGLVHIVAISEEHEPEQRTLDSGPVDGSKNRAATLLFRLPRRSVDPQDLGE